MEAACPNTRYAGGPHDRPGTLDATTAKAKLRQVVDELSELDELRRESYRRNPGRMRIWR